MGKVIGIVVLLIIIGAGAYFYFQQGGQPGAPATNEQATNQPVNEAPVVPPVTPETGTSTESETTEIPPVVDVPPPAASDVKVFGVKGGMFYFDVKEIRVKQGDKIRIVFENLEGMHDWVLDEFNARTPQISVGKTAVVEFTADKAGSFEYYCSVAQHRAMGMKGTLIVDPT